MSGVKEILAVDGRGLYFYFDRKKGVPVLNDANITVTRGTIYSLLGPSGCGKTTLLKCIVGQHKLQQGSLKVYGKIPGSKGFSIPGRGVGYMPQELGLYFEMSIEEIIRYFGSLYGMNRNLVTERLLFLLKLLALPEKKRMIKNLSGGQQRRVSFAIALVHKPPLLILDEPTVGVDPLLRQIIWNHLVTLAKNEHLTIIVTTHYTEEARQADIVGLMRNGHLLVESNPEHLIKQHGVIRLEDVFLKLCQQSDDEMDQENSCNLTSVESVKHKCLIKNGTALEEEKTFEKNGQDIRLIEYLKGLATEVYDDDIEKLVTKPDCCVNNDLDYVEKLIKTLIDPVNKYDGVFDEANGGQENTTALSPLASLPEEMDQISTTSVRFASLVRLMSLTRKNFLRLERNVFMIIFSLLLPTLQVIMFCLCLGSYPFGMHVAVVNLDEGVNRYGERFLLEVSNRTIQQKRYDNLTAAHESVKNGETWAALYIDQEFSSCLVDRILEGTDASNDTLLCSSIKLYVDKSNEIIATTIYFDLMEALQRFGSQLLGEYGKSVYLAESPIRIEEYIYGRASTSVMEFIAPAFVVAIAYIISISLAAMGILEEKKLGLFERTFIAGATAVEVLMSLFFVLFVILVIQVIMMILCAFFVFKIPCNGPLVWVIIGVTLIGVSGMAYGCLISTMIDDMITACVVAVASLFPTVLLSGIIWPVEAMPYYLRYISYLVPTTKIIDSVRSVVSRGWSIMDRNVWEGFMICNLWTVLLMVLSAILFKFRK